MTLRSIEQAEVELAIKTTVSQSFNAATNVGTASVDRKYKTALLSGIGANKINRIWHIKDIVGATNEQFLVDLFTPNIDAGNGSNNDGVGQPLTFDEIVFLCLVNKHQSGSTKDIFFLLTANDVDWHPDGAMRIGPLGSWFMFNPAADAIAISETKRYLRIVPQAGNNVNFDLMIMGRHNSDEDSSSSEST